MNTGLPRPVFLACLALAFPIGASAAVTLVFEKSVEVRTERIQLRDIARVEGAGQSTNRLMQVDLGSAPGVGKTVRLKTESVMRWVKGQYPETDVPGWRGATEVVLRSPAREVSADEIQDVARKALKSSVRESSWLLTQNRRQRGLLIVDLPYVLTSSVVQTTSKCERAAVQVDVLSDERKLASTTVWFRKDASVNEPPEFEGSCGIQREEFDSLGAERQSQAGVKKMDAVSIELRTSAVSIETTGTALSNARIGQPVRIQREGSTETFMATVISSGRVRVIDGDWK